MDFANFADQKWTEARQAREGGAVSIWARASEQVNRLALIYACSNNHENPIIDDCAVEWATGVMRWQVEHTLAMLDRYGSDNEFHALMQKARRILLHSGGSMTRNSLARKLKRSARVLSEVLEALHEQDFVDIVNVKTGKSGRRAAKIILK